MLSIDGHVELVLLARFQWKPRADIHRQALPQWSPRSDARGLPNLELGVNLQSLSLSKRTLPEGHRVPVRVQQFNDSLVLAVCLIPRAVDDDNEGHWRRRGPGYAPSQPEGTDFAVCCLASVGEDASGLHRTWRSRAFSPEMVTNGTGGQVGASWIPRARRRGQSAWNASMLPHSDRRLAIQQR
jgi:hypothetical protein